MRACSESDGCGRRNQKEAFVKRALGRTVLNLSLAVIGFVLIGVPRTPAAAAADKPAPAGAK